MSFADAKYFSDVIDNNLRGAVVEEITGGISNRNLSMICFSLT